MICLLRLLLFFRGRLLHFFDLDSTDLIKWGHAINSMKELKFALNENVQMIESDVGLCENQSFSIIKLFHYPEQPCSDLSLTQFVEIVERSNSNHSKKGIKLDFKQKKAHDQLAEKKTRFKY